MHVPHWLAQLSGDESELEDLPRWFPDEPVRVIFDAGSYYLTGKAFEKCSDHEQVRELAEAELDLVVASAKLLVGRFNRPEVTGLYRIDSQGSRHAYARGVTIDLEVRFKVRGYDGSDESPTRPQRYVRSARSQHALRSAMQLWADETRTWPRLYRMLEEIESAFGGRPVNSLGLCSSKERERFTRSANNPAVAGIDARHADMGHQPPKHPMTMQEANKFIGTLLVGALNKHQPPASKDGG
jgi:hypothetical protein